MTAENVTDMRPSRTHSKASTVPIRNPAQPARVPIDGVFIADRERLLRNASRITRDREDAADVVQEAFAAALEFASCCIEEPNWRAWVTTVVRNKATDLTRRKLRRAVVGVDVEGLPVEPLETQPHVFISSAKLRDALDACAPVLRSTFELRYVAGLTYSQLASTLNVPASTVATRLHRARVHLKALLVDSSGATTLKSRLCEVRKGPIEGSPARDHESNVPSDYCESSRTCGPHHVTPLERPEDCAHGDRKKGQPGDVWPQGQRSKS